MHELEEHELLKRFAYQAWLERGSPPDSPDVDWEAAKRMLSDHNARAVALLNSSVPHLTDVSTEHSTEQSIVSVDEIEPPRQTATIIGAQLKRRSIGAKRVKSIA